MELPKLLVASGPSRNAVQLMLDDLAKNHADIHLQDQLIPDYTYRGWSLLPANSTSPDTTEIKEVKGQRPLWLAFTGLTRDWSGVAEGMMQVPVFAYSMQHSADVLRPFGIDLLHMANHVPSDKFDLLACLVATTAIQVALVDVVRSLELRIDGLFGISAGDFVCGYADGALTSEQAVMVAYWSARCILDAPLEPSIMAYIGLSWDECAAKCPPEIKPSSQIDPTGVFVSGPKNAVAKFVDELESTGIQTKIIKAGYGFHSHCMAAAASSLQSRFETLIPDPKQRSARWLSTSVTRAHKEKYTSKLCDAHFYAYEMFSPVRFIDAVAEMPENAIIVEVGPQPYFQMMLRPLKPNAVHIPLVHQDPVSPLHPLLSAIGQLYVAGTNPKISAIFKKKQMKCSI